MKGSRNSNLCSAKRVGPWGLGRWLVLVMMASSGFSCLFVESRPPDIVLITVDALRPDHLGLYGYARDTSPHLDRFFASGAVFERAYSTQSNTAPSIVSILSGLYPQEHRVRLLYQLVPENCRLLPDLLPEIYQSAAFVSNFVLTDEATGLAARFDHYDDFVAESVPGRKVYERAAERTTDAALAWLKTERDGERPLFLWIHYIDPHGPYSPPEGWQSVFGHQEPLLIEPEKIPSHQVFDGLFDGREYVDRYDEEIAYTDAQIGRLLAGYETLAPLDEAFIVFTADHGESMMEHERWFSHGYHVYEEIVRVPLMVRGPGVETGRRSDLVSGIDLAPTILRFTGAAQVPSPEIVLSGIDLFDSRFAEPQRTIFAEATKAEYQWRLAIAGAERWFVQLERTEPEPRMQETRFYDLAADPGQLTAQPWPMDSSPAVQLREQIAADPDPAGWPVDLQKGIRLEAPKVDPRANAETLEKLRALGYVN